MSTHYVADLKITKVVKPEVSGQLGRNGVRDAATGEPARQIDEVTHIIVKGDDLKGLIDKTVQHLELEKDSIL